VTTDTHGVVAHCHEDANLICSVHVPW